METFNLLDQTFHLLPEKAVYWAEAKSLLIADAHIGKAQHFRNSGIPVPQMAEHNNLIRINQLIAGFEPDEVIFLGDLFHSKMNSMWSVFADFLKGFSKVNFKLVLGNHDIIPQENFAEAGMEILRSYDRAPFLMTHDRVETDAYNIHGHLHPGVRLRGGAKQALTVPCFYFGENHAVLPSFGDFTGLSRISPKKSDRIFVVAEGKVISVT